MKYEEPFRVHGFTPKITLREELRRFATWYNIKSIISRKTRGTAI